MTGGASDVGRRKPAGSQWWMGAALALASAAAAADGATALPVEMLDGTRMTFPADLPARPVLLVVGFTRESSSGAEGWYRSASKDEVISGAVEVYQVFILEDVPKMFRGFAVNSIRKDVPAPLHGRFALVTEQSSEWKTLVASTDPDVPYVLLLDAKRNVVWRSDRKVDRPSLLALRSELETLGRLP